MEFFLSFLTYPKTYNSWQLLSLNTLAFFFFNDTATTEIYTLSLHDALPISQPSFSASSPGDASSCSAATSTRRSEEHTSELQSLAYLVCRLLLEKKKTWQILILSRIE